MANESAESWMRYAFTSVLAMAALPVILSTGGAEAAPPNPVDKARALVASQPNNPAATNELGLALLAAGAKTDALDAFKQSVELTEKQIAAMSGNEQLRVCKPEVLARYLNYGSLLRELGQGTAAEEALRRAAKTLQLRYGHAAPNEYTLNVELAAAAESAGDYKVAALALERAEMPLVWPSEDCTSCYKLLGPRICDGNRPEHVDPVSTVRLRPGLPEPKPSTPLIAAKIAGLYLKGGDTQTAKTIFRNLSQTLDNPNTNLTSAEHAELTEAVRKGLGDIDEMERVTKEKRAAEQAARAAETEHRRAEADAARRRSPSYWAGILIVGIDETVRLDQAMRAKATSGFRTLAEDQYWPRLVDAETRLCEQVVQMKSALSEPGQVDEAITVGRKQLAYRRGDGEGGAFVVLARQYVEAPEGHCPRFTAKNPFHPDPASSKASTKKKRRHASP